MTAQQRIKPPANGHTNLSRPAPGHRLPADLAKLLDEHRRLTDEHNEAAGIATALSLSANADDQEARRADAAAAADAVRHGKSDHSATTNADSVKQRRTDVAHRVGVLSNAVAIVGREIEDARSAWLNDPHPHDLAEQSAAKLAKAADAYAKALSEASAARAVVEWLEGHPYDDTALVRLLDLDPNLTRILGPHGADLPAAVDARHVINAITSTLAKETAHV